MIKLLLLHRIKILPIWVLFLCCYGYSQIPSGIYYAKQNTGDQILQHRLAVSDNYLIHTVYRENPPGFIKTSGGFYEVLNDRITMKLEFNSDFDSDGIRELEMPIKFGNDELSMGKESLIYKKAEEKKQDLDGFWLFATRGPDTGQERRGDDRPRKTLKVLMDGTFQWIAYQTETFKFSGTGGGSYSANNGTYTEAIEFFSRDDSRVGAELQFQYEIKGNDWHHTGKNSRGEPMYEIWSKR